MSDLSIGIDVGGTKILGGVVDSTGKIIQTHRIDTPKAGGESLTSAIADVIKELAGWIQPLQNVKRLPSWNALGPPVPKMLLVRCEG